MSVRLPDGATVALATAYGSAITVSALTNANPPVATATAHGLTDGDLVVVTSNWSKINDRVVRVDASDVNTFAYEGIDASSTTLYPAGSGTGSVMEITTWTPITQILEFTGSGGDQQFANYSFLEDDFESQLPTVTSAQSIAIGIADDDTLAGYIALKAASEARAVRALKVTLPNGSVLLYNGYVTFNETPTMSKGQVMQVRATLSLKNKPVRYSA